MYFDVTEAKYLDKYSLTLRFEDGSTGKVDIAKYIDQGTVFQKLQDPDYFRGFRIEYGTLVWGEGEVNIAPETLYEEATGTAVSFESRRMAVL